MAKGSRGPAPKSAAVKKARGNPGKRAITTEQDEIALKALESDKELMGLDGESRPHFVTGSGVSIWKKLVPVLKKLNLMSPIDRFTFGRYCQNFGIWIDAQKSILKDGATYECKSAHGNYIKMNPSFMIASRVERELQAVEVKFGLNPADRQRLFVGRAGGQVGKDLFESPSVGVGGVAENLDGDNSSALGTLLN